MVTSLGELWTLLTAEIGAYMQLFYCGSLSYK